MSSSNRDFAKMNSATDSSTAYGCISVQLPLSIKPNAEVISVETVTDSTPIVYPATQNGNCYTQTIFQPITVKVVLKYSADADLD